MSVFPDIVQPQRDGGQDICGHLRPLWHATKLSNIPATEDGLSPSLPPHPSHPLLLPSPPPLSHPSQVCRLETTAFLIISTPLEFPALMPGTFVLIGCLWPRLFSPYFHNPDTVKKPFSSVLGRVSVKVKEHMDLSFVAKYGEIYRWCVSPLTSQSLVTCWTPAYVCSIVKRFPRVIWQVLNTLQWCIIITSCLLCPHQIASQSSHNMNTLSW